MQTHYHTNNSLPVHNESWYDMKQAAKILNNGMGRTKLFKLLRDNGVLMDKNEPYQRDIDAGLFKVVRKNITGRNGQLLFKQLVTLISDKGIDLIKIILKKE